MTRRPAAPTLPRRLVLAAPAALLLAGRAAAQPAAQPDWAGLPVDPARISEHVRVLASDAFEGRQPSTAGERKTVAYLIAAFRKMGLEPGGPGGGWMQWVPVTLSTLEGPATLALSQGGVATPLRLQEDITLFLRTRLAEVRLADAPLVFVGYGISRPTLGHDDLAGVDLRGKVALVLGGVPPAGPKGSDYDVLGTPRAKMAELAARGAAGVLFVAPEADEDWAAAQVTGQRPVIQPAADRGEAVTATPFAGFIRRGALAEILARGGVQLADLEAAAHSPGFRAAPLAGLALTARYRIRHRRIRSATVIGKITGRRRPDEVVIYSAHWDHLGKGDRVSYIGRVTGGGPGAAQDIYHGAVDNAAGVGVLLEIARNFAARPRPERTVAFVSFTEEEPGLVGSEYYMSHPVFPLGKTVANFTVDTVPLRATRDVEVIGAGRTDLEDDLARAATRRGVTLHGGGVEGNIYRRSDHFQFARAGVPVLYIHGGDRLAESGAEAEAVSRYATAYMRERYHHTTDVWRPDWDLRGAAMISTLLLDVGRELANSDRWPLWRPGVPFGDKRPPHPQP